MKTKRIIAAFMATTMLATTSITANAADYYHSLYSEYSSLS